jgi:hypothetical protein
VNILNFYQYIKMPKPKKYHIKKDRSKATKIDPKIRNSVECKCLLYCRGGKLAQDI